MKQIEVRDLNMNHKALVVLAPSYELNTKRKSYVFNGYNMWLVSYTTTVAVVDTDGKFRMLVNPSSVSNTTARHINKFIKEYAPWCGRDWKNCKVFVPDGI